MTRNRTKALHELQSATDVTDAIDGTYDPERVKSWALTGIGFAILDLADAIRETKRVGQ